MPMTVYIDPRRKVEAPTELTPEELEKKRNEELGMKVVQTFATLTLSPLVVMLIWNWVIPTLFGLPTLTYFTALGLYLLCKILFTNKND